MAVVGGEHLGIQGNFKSGKENILENVEGGSRTKMMHDISATIQDYSRMHIMLEATHIWMELGNV